MGGALLKGWLKAGVPQEAVIVIDPKGEDEIKSALGLDRVVIGKSLAQLGAIHAPRVVVFAVKPQAMQDVYSDLHDISLNNSLLLSVAAGIRIRAFEEQFGEQHPVVRAMPNLPTAIGKGISALFANSAANNSDIAFVEALMACVGAVVKVASEDDIDIVTCLSGSGPAYFFYLVEAMTDAGVTAGLPRDTAYQLSKETFIGTACLMEQSDDEAGILRKKVTSPKGTTEAALSVLTAEGGLKELMEKAIARAVARAKELSG